MYTVLFVDDEPNILQALKRAFFEYPEFEVVTATNAEEGAGILATRPVDVLVSDEKMPRVQGSQFVHYVKDRFPDVVRCILTGYADTEHILHAVNKGEVYRYLVKPWNDLDLISTVRSAAEYGRLKSTNRELQAKLETQNESLKREVARRTAYLEKALNTLKAAREETAENFDGIVNLLSHLLQKIEPESREFSSRSSRLAERMAAAMEMPREEIRNIRIAALLQEIGSLEHASAPYGAVVSRSGQGVQLLESVSSLGPIALLIRHRHERFDGTGEPDGLAAEEIPSGSRIIAVASDYVRLLYNENLSFETALEKMVTGITTAYDPRIVQVLRGLESGNIQGASKEIPIKVKDLQPGMMLKNDLLLTNGALALPQNTRLTASMVEHLLHYRLLDAEQTVYLRTVSRQD